MASDHDTINIHSSSVQDYQHGDDDDDDHPHSHHLSRLSMCNNTTTTTTTTNIVKRSSQLGTGDEEEEEEDMGVYISRLSIEEDGSDDGDADEEFSDSKEGYANKARGGGGLDSVLSSDSDREIGCLSLPATPPRRRSRRGFNLNQSSSSSIIGAKEYASDNEAVPNKGSSSSSSTGIFRNNSKMRGNPKSRRSSFFNRERWFERANWERKKKMQSDDNMFEHDQSLFMITRPRGGSRSLCMDLGEVKACRDLGFELEHERLEIPSGIFISAACSTIDTSSGGNSPISSWRISSPGDDPKDVKARLKMWAQAVALVSSSPPRQN